MQASIGEVAVLALFWLLAALTRKFRGFFFCLFLVFACIAVATILSSTSLNSDAPLLLALSYPFLFGGEWGWVPALPIGAILVLWISHLRGVRRPAVVSVAVGALAASLVAPSEVTLFETSTLPGWDPTQAEVSLGLDPEAELHFTGSSRLHARVHLPLKPRIGNLPENVVWNSVYTELFVESGADSTLADTSLHPSNRGGQVRPVGNRAAATFQRKRRWQSTGIEGNRATRIRQILVAQGVLQESAAVTEGQRADLTGFVDEGLCEAEELKAEGPLEVHFYSLDFLGALATTPGAELRRGTDHLYIARLNPDSADESIDLGGYSLKVRGAGIALNPLHITLLFLVDRSTGEIVELGRRSRGGTHRRLISTQPRMVHFSFEDVLADHPMQEGSEQELVFVDLEFLGAKTETVTLPPFSLEGCGGYFSQLQQQSRSRQEGCPTSPSFVD